MVKKDKSEKKEWEDKRKVCEAHDVSVAEAACLPQPLLAPNPTTRHQVLHRAKDRDFASLCAQTPFPLFIYLCPPPASNACSVVFSPAFHYSVVGQFTLALKRFVALKL